jgi:AraC-like DNA-binding protein
MIVQAGSPSQMRAAAARLGGRGPGLPGSPYSPVIRSSILVPFSRIALSLNLDPIDLMRQAGIDDHYLDDSDLTLPINSVVELLEIAAIASGIEDFGLRLAEDRGLPDFGPVTLMLREEETLRAALQTLITFMYLHSDAAYMNLEQDGDAILTVDIIGCGTRHRRQAIETSVAQTVSVIRWRLGEQWTPASICFTHSRPSGITRHERFFRCPVDYLREFNGIVLPQRDLDKRLPASSPALRRQIQRYVQTLDIAPRDSYAHRVTQLIAIALPRGEAKADSIAHHLGTDCRTLNRRLAKSGLNYSMMLENTRKDLAVRYMLDSDRPLSDIAGLVGFASLSAFSTWFRHAFGCAPSLWRKTNK